MGIFSKFGELIINFFSLIGDLIFAIIHLPERIRGLDREEVKGKIKTDKIKAKIKETPNRAEAVVRDLKTTTKTTADSTIHKKSDDDTLLISVPFTSEDKERTIFILQIVSAGFLIVSMLYLFNFFSFIIYIILSVLLAGYVIYVLFKKVKLMYGPDFPAYRDFFLMYIVVGVILVLVGTNSYFVMAFSFQFFPSLSILIFAVVAVALVFLIFRIKYSRDFTFGKVVEAGENTAYVKVDYDIRSNVKPDLYIVDNHYGAKNGDDVKLKVDAKILSGSGNKPVSIIGIMEKI
ncbi:MAG: DUF2101 family protein [Methanobacteriaceae archaeon]|nr:DUF2101 family protein [Methanobacteriaceae archaeon]